MEIQSLAQMLDQVERMARDELTEQGFATRIDLGPDDTDKLN